MPSLIGCRMFRVGIRSSIILDHFAQQQRLISHYTVLGISQTADLEEIKAAFRKKAKIIHPDAAPRDSSFTSSTDNRKEWVQLLTAYQILSDARSRHLYDLSRSSSSSSFLRQAAASGVKNGIHEDVEIDLNWNLGRAWTQPSKNQENNGNRNSTSTTVLDHLRNNLESDWHAAIRHAYLGPRLDDLAHGQLPECFEADERATQTTNEVLQLVSGRQELGSVRLRTALLTESEKKAWLGQGQCNHTDVRQDPALLAAFEVAELTTSVPGDDLANDLKQDNENIILDKNVDGQSLLNNFISGGGGDDRKISGTAEVGKSTFKPQPQILDLYLDGEFIATAVSRPAAASPATTSISATASTENANDSKMSPKSSNDTTSDPLDDKNLDKNNNNEQIFKDSIQGILTTYFYRSNSLLAQLVEEEPSLATTRRYSASKLLDPSGQHIFSIIRSSTPLVRHITFVAEHTTTVPGGGGAQKESMKNSKPNLIKKKTVVARAQRAWLPPSSFWLFKPRSYDHDIGGWVITWAGESQKNHPLWLDPSVLTLVAALDTLDHEKAKQQPYGLFERIKRGGFDDGGGGGGGWEGSSYGSNGGGRRVLEWVRDMLRFHRGNKE